LEKTKAELHDALMKERELNDLKSRFVSVASHEFRTPLTTIASSVSLMARYAETNDKEKQTKHIHRIKNAIDNLTDILDDFLSLSKLEEGKVNYVPEPFELELFINETVNEMQQIAKPGQVISYKHVGTHQAVFLDRKILKNVLLNLVSNAIKFSNEGKPIELQSNRKNGELTITITDHGVGIPKADQSHLFERFFRANNVTNVQGTGLGLSIVSKYVELMNGNIRFKSTENIGTTFTLTFNIDEKNSAHRR
jgi:signal transduction histidine kinase